MKRAFSLLCLLGSLTGGLSAEATGWTYAKQANLDEPCGATGQQLCGVVSSRLFKVIDDR